MNNIKDFILDTNEIAPAEDKPKATRKKPTIEFEVVLSDGIDGVVRRKSKTTSKLLVLMMSQRQFYIKDEKTNEVTLLDGKSLATFTRGICEGIEPVPWMTQLTGGEASARELCELLDNEKFCKLARGGYIRYEYGRDGAGNCTQWGINHIETELSDPLFSMIWKECCKVVDRRVMAYELTTRYIHQHKVEYHTELERKATSLIRQNNFLAAFNDKYGLDWARKLLQEWMSAPYTGCLMPYYYSYRNDGLLNITNFEPGRFIDYLLYESVRQGYGIANQEYGDLSRFINEWEDTLHMEHDLRNKIYDKYPKDLGGLHRRLSFQNRLISNIRSEAGFNEHSERLSAMSKNDGTYLIRPPFNKEDMADEAGQQANCLASYITLYAENGTDIFFMRSAKDPDKSLVTVEVNHGRIRQAYRACNRKPSAEELAWLDEWASENGIVGTSGRSDHPLTA